jgi:L-ribulokinase
VECFREQGVAIENINAVGGVARKSPLVMQILADVLNMPVRVLKSDAAVALGAAMFAAVAAGLYPDIPAAQKALCPPVEKMYVPNPAHIRIYDTLYYHYREWGNFEQNRSYTVDDFSPLIHENEFDTGFARQTQRPQQAGGETC